jgi:hypothetical protein
MRKRDDLPAIILPDFFLDRITTKSHRPEWVVLEIKTMSAYGQFSSAGANDWVDRLRDAVCHEPPPIDEAVLDSAYDACEIDTATMFAYFEGGLSEEERQIVEAEIATSPHALRKLTRIGAIVAQSRSVPAVPQRTPANSEHRFAAARSLSSGASPTESASHSPAVHRIRLSQPRSSIGNNLPRSEDCLRITPDSPCEFFRSLEKNRDQLRIFHHAAPVGTLVEIRLHELHKDPKTSNAIPAHFAVLRRGSEAMSTTTLTIPLSFKRGELDLELKEIPIAELSTQDANGLLNSYEKAASEDPVSVTPLHEPRSAWQIWADAVLKATSQHVDPAVREVAELIATS